MSASSGWRLAGKVEMACRQEWFTAQQLAGMPGMPTTERGIQLWGKKNLNSSRPKERGKGLEYSRDFLPIATRQYLDERDLQAVLQHLPPIEVRPAVPRATALAAAARQTLCSPQPQTLDEIPTTAAQRDRDLARRVILRTLRDILDTQGCSTRRAAQLLLERARAGQLAPAIFAKLEQACDERGRSAVGDDGLPSVVSILRWHRALDAGRSLAPRASSAPDLAIRPWYRAFFALTDRPQKPTLRWAHQTLVANWRCEWADMPGAAPPSYDACARAYAKRSELDKLKGRHTGSALRSRTFFHRRTYHDMAPFTAVHADGWTTHFTAPHPVTGAFVTYEVWHFHDVATRYVTPLAIGQTENTDVILDGLLRCIRVGGVPAIWQTDHSSSVKNARVMEEHAGLADRLGITVVHPKQVGNSQANGIAENFNTWLDREARALATYQHPERMDSGTFVRIRRITNAMVRAGAGSAERAALRAQAVKLGKGIVFDSYAEAVAWLEALVAKWNNHPHRELPKTLDAATGRDRPMTPQESLDAAIAAGWQPMTLPEEVLVDQFRPHLRKSVHRGCVTPFNGQRYHAPELSHLEGQEVLVAIDREDASRVDVKDLQGRLLMRCDLVAAVSPRTESMREHTERKRAEARVRLRENQIADIAEQIAAPALEAPAVNLFDLAALPALPRKPERELKSVADALASLPPVPRAPERRQMTPLEGFMHLTELEEAKRKAAG